MDLTALNSNTVLIFLLLFIRVGGMIIGAPLFSQRNVPVQLQVGFMVTITLVLFPLFSTTGALPITDMWQLVFVGGQEFLIGVIIGFVVNLVFAAVEMAGTMISQQMGLAMVQSFNPFAQHQSQGMGQLYFIVAATLFLTLNVHHMILRGVVKSLEYVPLQAVSNVNFTILANRLLELGSQMFINALLVAFPVFSILIILEVGLAYMSKVMPQMNIFIVSLPFKVWMGLFLMLVTFPLVIRLMGQEFVTTMGVLNNLYNF